MALTTKNSRNFDRKFLEVSTSTFSEKSTKPNHHLHILIFTVLSILLILFCAVSISSDDSSARAASMIIPISRRQLLSSTMNSFNTKKVNGDKSTDLPASKSNRKAKFEGDAHEVPSGPNPISNR
ncbi:hypothetical protein DCAR_0314321 [Daucus carota subsp. sativus]|uniref:Uncharacterized protein n=1 Tax=Daucus carota subsp. sativus TaxID=79200 RepID=A0AAF0WT98_DAUCS|nr:hypothetical protein DCAR_0314321 [Daucus carota subsp. sativus]